ncbi:MAG: HPP family protein [Gammaproteobacteria bacterium]|nr:HPP family protein [Gammaproteobacteria bacterium]
MSNLGERIGQALSRWRLVDTKFRQNRGRYALQTSLAGLAILVVLLLLDNVRQTVLIASLAATAFIAFSIPRSYPSRPRYIIGGYLVGTVVGCTMSVASLALAWGTGFSIHTAQIIAGSVAAGLAFFLMVTTETEHPPAAALALGYVLNEWDGWTVLVVLAGATALSLIKEALRSRLMDLG